MQEKLLSFLFDYPAAAATTAAATTAAAVAARLQLVNNDEQNEKYVALSRKACANLLGLVVLISCALL